MPMSFFEERAVSNGNEGRPRVADTASFSEHQCPLIHEGGWEQAIPQPAPSLPLIELTELSVAPYRITGVPENDRNSLTNNIPLGFTSSRSETHSDSGCRPRFLLFTGFCQLIRRTNSSLASLLLPTNGKLLTVSDQITCLFRNHCGGSVCVRADQAWKDTAVADPQALESVHFEFRVHHTAIVRTHPAGSDGMI